jgi:hypothetical protein
METFNPPPPQSPITPPEMPAADQQPMPQQEVPDKTATKMHPLVEKFKALDKNQQLLIVAGSMLGVILLLLILVALMKPKQSPLVLTPSPSPVLAPSPTAPPRETSAFAKTPEFAHFEQGIRQLQNDNLTVDLSEPNLSYPLLDMDVNFRKQ